MKNKKGVKEMMFLLGLAATETASNFNELSESSQELLKEMQEANKKHQNEKIMLNRGLKKFNIIGQDIWAINKKVAIRKYNKRNK